MGQLEGKLVITQCNNHNIAIDSIGWVNILPGDGLFLINQPFPWDENSKNNILEKKKKGKKKFPVGPNILIRPLHRKQYVCKAGLT